MSFKINRVYTRSGDGGETGLVGGGRISKSSLRVEAIGTADELNSTLGILRDSLSKKLSNLSELVLFLQQELFDLGSELATPADAEYSGMWKASEANIKNLEKLCDKYAEGLPELSSFILPGGSLISSYCHQVRSIARRAERIVHAFMQEEEAAGREVNKFILQYLNRLSDLFFILARYVLKEEGKPEVLWVQEKGRRCPV